MRQIIQYPPKLPASRHCQTPQFQDTASSDHGMASELPIPAMDGSIFFTSNERYHGMGLLGAIFYRTRPVRERLR